MNRLTREQAAIIGSYTGICASGFGPVHEYAEKILERPIFSHEFAGKEIWKELKEKSKDDFLSICYEEGENK